MTLESVLIEPLPLRPKKLERSSSSSLSYSALLSSPNDKWVNMTESILTDTTQPAEEKEEENEKGEEGHTGKYDNEEQVDTAIFDIAELSMEPFNDISEERQLEQQEEKEKEKNLNVKTEDESNIVGDERDLDKEYYDRKNNIKQDQEIHHSKDKHKDTSIDLVAEQARSIEGIINNEERRIIWSKLLLLEDTQPKTKPGSLLGSPSPALHSQATFSPDGFLQNLESVDLPPHKDEDQVKLDIQRSFTVLNHIQTLHNCYTITSSISGFSTSSSPLSATSSHSDSDTKCKSTYSSTNSLSVSNARHSAELASGVDFIEKGSSFTNIISASDINSLRKILSNLIIKVLRKHPSLHYYQGYHDIASIILLVCYDAKHNQYIEEDIDQDLAFRILEKLTVFHLRDFMISDIALSVNHLRLIPALLEQVDTELFQLLRQTSILYFTTNGKLYDYKFLQGLSSILTIFSHDISNLSHILTIWDFNLGYNSVIVNVYIYAASIVFFKQRIWETLQLEEHQCDFKNVDHDAVHKLISPATLYAEGLTDSDLARILEMTKSFLEEYPMNKLDNEGDTWQKWFIEWNPHSVLLTTSDLATSRVEVNAKYAKDLLESGDSQYSLEMLIAAQEKEIMLQTLAELEVFHKIIAEQDQEAEDEYLQSSIASSQYEEEEDEDEDDSETNSLGSSLTRYSSIASSLTSSSLYKITSATLKKLFPLSSLPPIDEDDKKKKKKKLVIRNKNWFISKKFYCISITVGIIGVFLHFLFVKYGGENVYKEFMDGRVMQEIKHTLGDVRLVLSRIVSPVTTLGGAKHTTTSVLDAVGTGTLRNSAFGI